MEQEMIGFGCTRKVYADGDYVLKIPYNDSGKIQAEKEYTLFQTETLKPYLAEIVEYDETTGKIKMERLYDCHLILSEGETAKNNFPAELLAIINNKILQVGYDKNQKLKVFDYGQEAADKRDIDKETKDMLWNYRLKLRGD